MTTLEFKGAAVPPGEYTIRLVGLADFSGRKQTKDYELAPQEIKIIVPAVSRPLSKGTGGGCPGVSVLGATDTACPRTTWRNCLSVPDVRGPINRPK